LTQIEALRKTKLQLQFTSITKKLKAAISADRNLDDATLSLLFGLLCSIDCSNNAKSSLTPPSGLSVIIDVLSTNYRKKLEQTHVNCTDVNNLVEFLTQLKYSLTFSRRIGGREV